MSSLSGVCVAIMKMVERPRWVSSNRRWACRLSSAVIGMSISRSTSPGPRMFSWFPVTKSTASTVRSDPSGAHSVYVASSATVNVIIGPAGSDMQMLPPTVAEFHTLNDARNASQPVWISGAARQLSGVVSEYRSWMVAMAPILSPSAPMSSASQPSGMRSMRRRRSGCWSENSHVPPASQASPGRHSAPGRSAGRRMTSVIVLRSKSVPP